tara:strand:- start:1657 stop:3576 length:1920 start_codon:yes stop_codon:yes gene_type:complete
MTVLEDTELNVVDDRMALLAIQISSLDEQSVEQKRRAMEFAAATSVSFSYKNLARVDYLAPFRDLTKLQLDNNSITTIEGLDHLTQLKWLDLSFNQLEKIEGLQALTKLEDLSLYHNKITTIEGLEACTGTLVSLSLGENDISELGKFDPLRKLTQLRLANFVGNPVTSEEDYAPYVLSRTVDLKYLDHRLVRQAAIDKARDQYADELAEIEAKEEEQRQTKQKQKIQKQKDDKAKEMNVLGVSDLFDDMLSKDPEFEKLRKLPSEKEGGVLTKGLLLFREAFERLVEEFQKQLEKQFELKKLETKEWREVLDSALHEKNTQAKLLVKKLLTEKKHAFRALELDEERNGQGLDQDQQIGAEPANIKAENVENLKRIKQVLREAKNAARSERLRDLRSVTDEGDDEVEQLDSESDDSDLDSDDGDLDDDNGNSDDDSQHGKSFDDGNSDSDESEIDVFESTGRWLRKRNLKTKEKLLAIELHCADFTSELIFEYDRNYSDICDKSRQLIVNLFTEMRANEDVYFAEMSENATVMLEQFSTGKLDEVCDEDANVVLQDKDTFMNAVRAHHDFHVNAIDQREDQLGTEEKRRLEKVMADLKTWERERNRSRVNEIITLWERTATQIDEFCGEEDDDDEEEAQ